MNQKNTPLGLNPNVDPDANQISTDDADRFRYYQIIDTNGTGNNVIAEVVVVASLDVGSGAHVFKANKEYWRFKRDVNTQVYEMVGVERWTWKYAGNITNMTVPPQPSGAGVWVEAQPDDTTPFTPAATPDYFNAENQYHITHSDGNPVAVVLRFSSAGDNIEFMGWMKKGTTDPSLLFHTMQLGSTLSMIEASFANLNPSAAQWSMVCPVQFTPM